MRCSLAVSAQHARTHTHAHTHTHTHTRAHTHTHRPTDTPRQDAQQASAAVSTAVQGLHPHTPSTHHRAPLPACSCARTHVDTGPGHACAVHGLRRQHGSTHCCSRWSGRFRRPPGACGSSRARSCQARCCCCRAPPRTCGCTQHPAPHAGRGRAAPGMVREHRAWGRAHGGVRSEPRLLRCDASASMLHFLPLCTGAAPPCASMRRRAPAPSP
jgi:hypothetical protein